MKRRDFTKEGQRMASLRLPKKLGARAWDFARKHDMTFSQLVRRALKREIGELTTK